MSDLHLSPYTGRIIEVSGADHREALIVETALRWGLGEGRERANPGTLDHLDAAEFDRQVRQVVRLFAARPSEREAIEREAVAERLIPRAARAEGALKAGNRVRVWFTGNGVVVEAPDNPWTKPYAIRLDGADADTYYTPIRSGRRSSMNVGPSDRVPGDVPIATPTLGERFVLTVDVERFPHFVAARGSKGTVADVSHGAISLRLDEPLPGAEEWDNEIVWGDGVGRDFWEDVERLPPGDDRPQGRVTNEEDEAGWLVEWDGGWETAATPEAAGKIVEAKIAEWGDVDRDDFRIVPNVPPPEDMTRRAP